MENINIISYENDPSEFVRLLRMNLSSDNHTKETLIDFAVHVSIEAELREIELKKYKNLAVEKIQSENLANQFFSNTKTWDLNQIANVLEKDFGFIDIANLLRSAFKKAYKQNKPNSELPRKHSPSRTEVEQFKTKWVSQNKIERGWLTAAALEFSIDAKTVKERLNGK